jgi:spermidine/putrescine transport system substrate-binding protein
MIRSPKSTPVRALVGLAAAALLLGACGGDGAASRGGDARDGAVTCAPGETDGDLRLYQWAEYDVPGLFEAFEATYGVRVIQDFYGSNEDMLARVLIGGAPYDVVVPSDYAVQIMVEEGLLRALDRTALPGIDNISIDFTQPYYDPGLQYSLPYVWGTTGLGINVELLGDVEPSWRLLFDPEVAGRLPGRVAMLDDPREVLGAALHLLGLDPNTTSERDLEQAGDVLAGARPWTAVYTSQYADLLVAGDVVVAQGYNGTFLTAFGDDPRFAYVIPKEGGTIWTDNLAILADAAHPCTAHTFLAFMLDGERAAQLSNATGYASPNEAALPFLDPSLLADPSVYPPDEVRERLRFLVDTGTFEPRFTEVFERARR